MSLKTITAEYDATAARDLRAALSDLEVPVLSMAIMPGIKVVIDVAYPYSARELSERITHMSARKVAVI